MKATITYLRTGKQEILTLDLSDGEAIRATKDGRITLETKAGIHGFSKEFVEKIELTFD